MFADGSGLELSHLNCYIKCSDESCIVSNFFGLYTSVFVLTPVYCAGYMIIYFVICTLSTIL